MDDDDDLTLEEVDDFFEPPEPPARMKGTPKHIPGYQQGMDEEGVIRKRNGHELVMSKKQVRARARRRTARSGSRQKIYGEELVAIGYKPVEEWDLDELAAGKPKDENGRFRTGPPPKWITREVKEQSVERFKEMMRAGMQGHTVKAMAVLRDLLEDETLDDKGKPVVPWSTKADVAKFMIEHLLGKPTQPVKADVNVRLQGLLANVLVQPGDSGGYVPSSSHSSRGDEGVVDGEIVDDDEDIRGGGE